MASDVTRRQWSDNMLNFSAVSFRTGLGRALRFPLKLIPPDTKVPIIQGPLRGKKWIIGSGTHGCWLGSYEPTMQRALLAAIKPGDAVYDLGANVGFYSLLASVLVGPEGKVASFEPVQRNLEFLKIHLKLNGVSNCAVWDAAVGSSNGTAEFDFELHPSMGHIAFESSGKTTKVRVVALDALVADGSLMPPNIIKCDVEGAEYDALQGAYKILVTHRPTIFLATHGTEIHRQCCKFLLDLNYRLTSMDERPLEEAREIFAAG